MNKKVAIPIIVILTVLLISTLVGVAFLFLTLNQTKKDYEDKLKKEQEINQATITIMKEEYQKNVDEIMKNQEELQKQLTTQAQELQSNLQSGQQTTTPTISTEQIQQIQQQTLQQIEQIKQQQGL